MIKMATVKFNKVYKDKKLKKVVKSNEPVEMSIERADEIVKKVKSQKVKGYEDFGYEVIKKEEKKSPKKEKGD